MLGGVVDRVFSLFEGRSTCAGSVEGGVQFLAGESSYGAEWRVASVIDNRFWEKSSHFDMASESNDANPLWEKSPRSATIFPREGSHRSYRLSVEWIA